MMTATENNVIEYMGKTITPMDNGYGRTVYGYKGTQYGKLESAKDAIVRDATRPRCEMLDYRGIHMCSKRTWPDGRVTFHGYDKQFGSFGEFAAYVDGLFGPPVADKALANIKPGSRVEDTKREPTTAQRNVIKRMERDILEHDGLGLPRMAGYEYKDFTLTAGYGGTLYLTTTVGMKGDHGTAAAVLARTHRHMAIGVRGGVRCMQTKKTGYRNVMIWGGKS